MPSSERPIAADAYDRLGQDYEALEADPYCADFEFPAMKDLLPNVEGQHVLDAGCGRGRYTEWLLDEGADVTAVDASEEMVAETRRRVGDRADVQHADITEPLAFVEDETVDGVVCGLSLHYVEDWREAFAEFARVLRPGGFLAFSAQNPVDEYVAFDAEDYFAVERLEMTWSAGDDEVDVPFYRRPFAEVVNPLVETGFRIDELVEPKPEASFEEKKPESYEKRLTYPTFLCVRASKSKRD
jgi:SAM-dependent methyltransferase